MRESFKDRSRAAGGSVRSRVPLPAELPELAGGIYTIQHSASEPSSLTLELLSPGTA